MSPCQQWVSKITYEQHRLAKKQNIDEGRSEMMKHGGSITDIVFPLPHHANLNYTPILTRLPPFMT
jgi:hypothetical protein